MNIKLIATDIDGVWTDGGMYYGSHGNELKKFNAYDGAGILFLKTINIPTVIITGEDTGIVKSRAEKLGINYVFQGVEDKLSCLKKLCLEIGIDLSEVAYIGDDINDIKVLENVGLSATPSSAPNYVKKYAHWNLRLKGGEGVFREFVEKLLTEQGLFEKALQGYLTTS